MACAAIATGGGFLSATLSHIDCQSRTIGAYGYGALANPNSTVFAALTGLLTIFVALYGVRLLLGHAVGARDVIHDVIKLGIVLTLATSWPAWRTLGYDVVMNGPFELAGSIGLASGIAQNPDDITARLQNIDDGVVVVTTYGTGRLTAGAPGGNEPGNAFAGIALADQFALGVGRAAFLIGSLVPFAIFRLGGGILLALAPLLAGLMLFTGTRDFFVGWVRGLIFCALGSLAHLLVQNVQISMFEPWLQNVITSRSGGTVTPSAPTELFVIGIAFSGINIGILMLFARIAFQSGFTLPLSTPVVAGLGRGHEARSTVFGDRVETDSSSRALTVSQAVASTMRSEERRLHSRGNAVMSGFSASEPAHRGPDTSSSDQGLPQISGSARRRTTRQMSASAQKRDRK